MRTVGTKMKGMDGMKGMNHDGLKNMDDIKE